MAKCILMSIKPKYVSMILNKDKTIEIRRRFPSDYVGWVYMYCTKEQGLVFDSEGKGLVNSKLFPYAKNCPEHDRLINGKVVARFWCDKVENFEFCEFSKHKDNLELYNECVRKDNELCKKACIGCVQMVQYLDTKAIGKNMFGKAIHITKVEPFDKPKEISEFHKVGYFKRVNEINIVGNPSFAIDYENAIKQYAITRAPESYYYIEIE